MHDGERRASDNQEDLEYPLSDPTLPRKAREALAVVAGAEPYGEADENDELWPLHAPLLLKAQLCRRTVNKCTTFAAELSSQVTVIDVD